MATQDDKRERRKRISDFVKKGNTVPQAARKFKVTTATVNTSCAEFGVRTRSGFVAEAKTIMIVWLLIEGKATKSAIAKHPKISCSRQHVDHVLQRCKAFKIKVGKRHQ